MDYAPNTEAQLEAMLHAIGVERFEELLEAVPADLRQGRLDIPPGLTEPEVLALCGALAERNRPLDRLPAFLGAGAYQHTIPTVVDAIAARVRQEAGLPAEAFYGHVAEGQGLLGKAPI